MTRTLLATLVLSIAAFGATAARADNSAEPQWPNTPTNVKPVMKKGEHAAKPMDKMHGDHAAAPMKKTDYRFLTDYSPA